MLVAVNLKANHSHPHNAIALDIPEPSDLNRRIGVCLDRVDNTTSLIVRTSAGEEHSAGQQARWSAKAATGLLLVSFAIAVCTIVLTAVLLELGL